MRLVTLIAGRRPYMFETPPEESFDIDTEFEWQLAKTIATELYSDMHSFDDANPDKNSVVLGVKVSGCNSQRWYRLPY